MARKSFESFAPVNLGPLQLKPNNPFEGDFSIGVNIVLDGEGAMHDLEASKGVELTDPQLELLGSYALRSKQNSVQLRYVPEDINTRHALRVRNGSRNLRAFPHIDNRSFDTPFVKQARKYGSDGQYVFVTGREAPVWYRGRFHAPEGLKGVKMPIHLAASLQRQVRGKEPLPLMQDTLYQLGLATVHSAPKSSKDTSGLFIGGYVVKD